MYTGPWNYTARQVLRLHQRTQAPFACCRTPMRVTRRGLRCTVCGYEAHAVPANILLAATNASIRRHVTRPQNYVLFWWMALSTSMLVSALLPDRTPWWGAFLLGIAVYFLVRAAWIAAWTYLDRHKGDAC